MGQGILGLHGANMIVEKTVVEGFDPGPAIGLSNSAAELIDVTLRNNGLGIDAYSNSTLILQGDVDISRNQRGGMTLNLNTTAEIRGANLRVDNNGGVGILVVGDSRLAFSGFDVKSREQSVYQLQPRARHVARPGSPGDTGFEPASRRLGHYIVGKRWPRIPLGVKRLD